MKLLSQPESENGTDGGSCILVSCHRTPISISTSSL